jgi:hypothetical protein
MREFYNALTFTAICRDKAAINCITVQQRKGSFPSTLTGHTTLVSQINGKFVLLCTGYGNIAPQTEIGKVVTIIYAIIGMPLFLLYLSNIGDILAKSFKWTYAKCCLCHGCCDSASRRRSFRRHQMALQQPAPVGAFIGDDWRVSANLHQIICSLFFALFVVTEF